MQIAFLCGEELLGVGETNFPTSRHYCCDGCGRVWGSELVLDSPSAHSFQVRGCASCFKRGPTFLCGRGNEVLWDTPPIFCAIPLFHAQTPDLVRSIPRDVLKRDFLILCELLEL